MPTPRVGAREGGAFVQPRKWPDPIGRGGAPPAPREGFPAVSRHGSGKPHPRGCGHPSTTPAARSSPSTPRRKKTLEGVDYRLVFTSPSAQKQITPACPALSPPAGTRRRPRQPCRTPHCDAATALTRARRSSTPATLHCPWLPALCNNPSLGAKKKRRAVRFDKQAVRLRWHKKEKSRLKQPPEVVLVCLPGDAPGRRAQRPDFPLRQLHRAVVWLPPDAQQPLNHRIDVESRARHDGSRWQLLPSLLLLHGPRRLGVSGFGGE
jgi:hypothetical protein